MPSLSRSPERSSGLIGNMEKKFTDAEERSRRTYHAANERRRSMIEKTEVLRLAAEKQLGAEFHDFLFDLIGAFNGKQERREKAFQDSYIVLNDVVQRNESRRQDVFDRAQVERHASFQETWKALLRQADNFAATREDYDKQGHESRLATWNTLERRIRVVYEEFIAWTTSRGNAGQEERARQARETLRHHRGPDDGNHLVNGSTRKGKQRDISYLGVGPSHSHQSSITEADFFNVSAGGLSSDWIGFSDSPRPASMTAGTNQEHQVNRHATPFDVHPSVPEQAIPHLALPAPRVRPGGNDDHQEMPGLYVPSHRYHWEVAPDPLLDPSSIPRTSNGTPYPRSGSPTGPSHINALTRGETHDRVAGAKINDVLLTAISADRGLSTEPDQQTQAPASHLAVETSRVESVREQISIFREDFKFAEAERAQQPSNLIYELQEYLKTQETACLAAHDTRSTRFHEGQSKFARQFHGMMDLQSARSTRHLQIHAIATEVRDTTFKSSATTYDQIFNQTMMLMANEVLMTQALEDQWIQKKETEIENIISDYQTSFNHARTKWEPAFQETAGLYLSFFAGLEKCPLPPQDIVLPKPSIAERQYERYEAYASPTIQTVNLNGAMIGSPVIPSFPPKTDPLVNASVNVYRNSVTANATDNSVRVQTHDPIESRGVKGFGRAVSLIFQSIFFGDQLHQRRRETALNDRHLQHLDSFSKMLEGRRSAFDSDQKIWSNSAAASEAGRDFCSNDALLRYERSFLDAQASAESAFHAQEKQRGLNFSQAQGTRQMMFIQCMNQVQQRCLRAERERQAEFDHWAQTTLMNVMVTIAQQKALFADHEDERDEWVRIIMGQGLESF